MKNILLLGGTGFVGQSIVVKRPQWNWTVVGSADIDLTDSRSLSCAINRLGEFDVIINAAGFYGGFLFNQRHGKKIFYQNSIINTNVCQLVESLSPAKFINIGSASVYPCDANKVIDESQITCNNPHPSVIYSAKSKMQMLDMMSLIEIPWEFLIVGNVYGPGEHLDAEKSHVVGGLISKLKQSNQTLEVMGTGNAVRDFIYVDDMAEVICRYVEKTTATSSVSNISSGVGISIKELVETIVKVSNKNLTIKWGTPDQDGILYKVLDNSKMIADTGHVPSTCLTKGLQNTWQWANTQRI